MKWVSHPSRDKIFSELRDTVELMQEGDLEGTGSCFAIVGPRGTGKSMLLERLVRECAPRLDVLTKAHLDKCKDVVEAAYSVVPDAFDGYPGAEAREDVARAVDRLNAYYMDMEEGKCGLLVVIDQCEKLYSAEFDDGQHERIMQFLDCVANIQGPRRIVSVLTGSAPRVRPLLFTKLDPLDESVKSKHPRYNGAYDLNSGKTVPLLLDTRNWTERGYYAALRVLLRDAEWRPTKNELRTIYAGLGGTLRTLQTAVRRAKMKGSALVQQAEASLVDLVRRPAPGLMAHVRFIMDKIEPSVKPNEAAYLKDPFSFRVGDVFIHADEVVGRTDDEGREITYSALYDISDDGYLYYDDRSRCVIVPCVHSVLAYRRIRNRVGKVTPFEELVLRHPLGVLGVFAELLLGTCLNAKKGGPRVEDPFSLPLWRFRKENQSSKLIRRYLKRNGAVVLKEDPDKQGSDLVLLERGERDTVSMTRIQVKLMQPRTDSKEQYPPYATVFRKKQDVYVDGLKASFVLATTYKVTEEGREKCRDNGVEIWDRTHLCDKVWKGSIGEWANENSITTYIADREGMAGNVENDDSGSEDVSDYDDESSDHDE